MTRGSRTVWETLNVMQSDGTYPAVFVWLGRLIVLGLVVLFVTELVHGIRGFLKALRK